MSKPSTYLKAYAYPGADLMESCVDACEATLKTGTEGGIHRDSSSRGYAP